MWCDIRILLLFLCYATLRHGVLADAISDFENQVELLGIRSFKSNDLITTVQINGQNYNIFDPRSTDATEKGDDDTVRNLFICINCVFAGWARGELFDLISIFPVLYHWNFASLQSNVFIEKHEDIDNNLKLISKTVSFLMLLLFNFFEIHTYSTYHDRTVLKTLLSLKIRIHYLLNLYDPQYDDKTEFSERQLDVDVVKIIMGIINDLQIFMTANCQLSEKYNYKPFSLYFEILPPSNEFTDFLYDIKLLELDKPQWYLCTRDKLLLHNFLSFNYPDRNILKGIWSMLFVIGCDFTTSFYEVFKIVNASYDLDVTHWYQEAIMNTIILLILRKVSTFFSTQYNVDDPNPQSFTNEFAIINSEFLSVYTTLPKEVTEAFNVLASNKEHDKKRSEWLTLFPDGNISEYTGLRPYAKFYSKDNHMDRKSDEYKELFNISLDGFLTFLIENIGEFKCFLGSFKLLNKELNEYYMPFKRNYNTIIETVFKSKGCKYIDNDLPFSYRTPNLYRFNSSTNSTTQNYVFLKNYNVDYSASNRLYIHATHIALNSDPDIWLKYNIRHEGCHLFTALYHHCIDALRHINIAFVTGSKEEFQLARQRLNKIKEHLIKANENSFNHRIQTIIYNIMPYVDFHFERHSNVFNINYFRRIMSILSIELSNYGLDYCHPPNHDFLTFHNIHEFGDLKYYDRIIERYFERVESTRELEDTLTRPSECQKIMSLSSVFDFYSKYQELYTTYDDSIRFQWKGEEFKNIREIYDDVLFNVLQPFYYYSFVDVFLKFSFAVIFYEIKEFWEKNKPKLKKADCYKFYEMYERIEYMQQFSAGKFRFRELTHALSMYLSNVQLYLCTKQKKLAMKDMKKFYTEVFYEFLELQVFIFFPKKPSTSTDNTSEKQSQLTGNPLVAQKSEGGTCDSDNAVTINTVFIDVMQTMYETIFLIDRIIEGFAVCLYV